MAEIKKFLDSAGVEYLWEKIKTWTNSNFQPIGSLPTDPTFNSVSINQKGFIEFNDIGIKAIYQDEDDDSLVGHFDKVKIGSGNLVFDNYSKGIVFSLYDDVPAIYLDESDDSLAFSMSPKFKAGLSVGNHSDDAITFLYPNYISRWINETGDNYRYALPDKSGTLATLEDLMEGTLQNICVQNDRYYIYMSTANGGFYIYDSTEDIETIYNSGYIIDNGNIINLPNKSGTLATLGDIPTKTSQLQNDSNFLVNGQGAKHTSIILGTDIGFGENGEYTGLRFINNPQADNPAMYVGDNQSVLYLYSLAKPWWVGANGEGGRLAMFDEIPTRTSQLINDANFLTQHQSLANYYNKNEVDTKVGAQIPLSQKGTANGVATLDANGFIPSSQLPSYVDDVLEYTSKPSFPSTGTTGKIYVDTSTNLTYRWGGSTYVEISSSLALGETSSTAYAGDKGKANADAITALQNNKLDKSSVVDNLTSTSTSSALSAAQGKVLNDKFASYLTVSSANSTYQTKLTSGTNIKTINGQSLLGSGDITISGGSGGSSFNGGDITNNVNMLNDKSISFYDVFGSKCVEINSTTGARFTNSSVYITSGILSVDGTITTKGIYAKDNNMGGIGSSTNRFQYMYVTELYGSDGICKNVSDIALKSDIPTSGSGGSFNGGDITNDLNIKNGKALNVYDPFGYKVASLNCSWGLEMTSNIAIYIGERNSTTAIRLGTYGLINGSGNGFNFKNDGSISVSSGQGELLFPEKNGTLATTVDIDNAIGDINSILDILNGEVV